MTTSGPDDDLGALIGEVRREAARRRSDPAYPLGEEAALDAELRQSAPEAPPPELERLARAAEVAGAPDLAQVVADALRVTARRLTDMEHRLRRLERSLSGGDPQPTALPVEPEPDGWAAGLPGDLVAAGPGRVLCFAADPAAAVADLRGRGVDAYGLTPAGDPFVGDADVRAGEILDHLGSVEDSGLRAAVTVGLAVAVAGPGPYQMAAELARVAPLAVVLSESPWWWRERGGLAAELAPRRVLSADLWLDAFSRAGMDTEAEYVRGGRAYRLVARRRSGSG